MTETMTMVPADVKPFARSLKGPPVVCGGFGGAPCLSLSLSRSRALVVGRCIHIEHKQLYFYKYLYVYMPMLMYMGMPTEAGWTPPPTL